MPKWKEKQTIKKKLCKVSEKMVERTQKLNQRNETTHNNKNAAQWNKMNLTLVKRFDLLRPCSDFISLDHFHCVISPVCMCTSFSLLQMLCATFLFTACVRVWKCVCVRWDGRWWLGFHLTRRYFIRPNPLLLCIEIRNVSVFVSTRCAHHCVFNSGDCSRCLLCQFHFFVSPSHSLW